VPRTPLFPLFGIANVRPNGQAEFHPHGTDICSVAIKESRPRLLVKAEASLQFPRNQLASES